MESNPSIDFERKRGIIWVCDVQGSSAALNNEITVDYMEEYLPRLFWISDQLVKAAGGEFIKWTGDGFLAWFDCEIERNMGKVAAAVYDAAWHLSFTNNVTNLDVDSPVQFTIRHGIVWEPDALIMHIKYFDKRTLKDMIGQKIVLAFRCSGIRVDFPHIVTENKLMKKAQKVQGINHKFKRLKLEDEDILIYFKGEKQFVRYLVGSSEARKSKHTKRSMKDQVNKTIDPSANDNNCRYLSMINEYVRRLRTGPTWAQKVLEQEISFIRDDMLSSLKYFVKSTSGNKDKTKVYDEEYLKLITIIEGIIKKIDDD